MKKQSILEEQISYYRARAPEYDEWFLRKGRYDVGADDNQRWHAETKKLRSALHQARPCGRILELACGTGWWTRELVVHCQKLTAVDSSPEAIALNQSKINDDRVEYIETNMFHWKSESLFDFVFFGFWLSHVPDSHMELFWRLIERSLRPGGKLFFVDNLIPSTPDSAPPTEDNITRRRLNDGREFNIVKVFYDPDELARAVRNRGWKGDVCTTGDFFLYGRFERV